MTNAEEILQNWLRHRKVLQEMTERFDDAHLNFKPWEDAFTAGGLIVHMASVMEMFVKTVKQGVFTPPASYPYETMDDIRKIVHALTDKTQADLGSLTDAQLEAEIEVIGRAATGHFWLLSAVDHEIHHKGQLFTYARMLGIDGLPFFRVLPPPNALPPKEEV
ncbi:DinB family protein [Paenibacillus humicola]|uniref:DinB family protein n=1 Tax=Paenibacillus humicola TaxID=3110540 RepID=UPI00237C4AEF|nr:DinB family protein [Paenibacillus humicola]